MDNLNLLCQTIRFQRTALQQSLAMVSAVQQHGERFLKTTLDQNPWIPGDSKDACLFLAGIWRKNLTGMSELVDKNLATMERLTSSTGGRVEKMWKQAEKTATELTKHPQPEVTARKESQEKKEAPEKTRSSEKEESPPKETEQTAKAAAEAKKTQAAAESPEKKPEQPGKQQPEKKKPS